MQKLFFPISLFLTHIGMLMAGFSWSQTGVVIGRVYDDTSNQPLEFAAVSP